MTFTNWHTKVVVDQLNNEEYLYNTKIRKFNFMRLFHQRITASSARAFANHYGLLTYAQMHDEDFCRSKVVWSEVAAFWNQEYQEWLSFELSQEAERATT